MLSKEYKKQLDELNILVAKLKIQFKDLKDKEKQLSFSERRQVKKQRLEVRAQLRKAQKDRNDVKRQYKLQCQAEGIKPIK